MEHTRQIVIDNKSISTWDNDYPSGGNYWDNYLDVDVKSGSNQDQPGSDGIWDSAYVIDTNNQDRYPYVKPYGDIPEIIRDKTRPTANAGSDKVVKVGASVTFDGSKSTDDVGIVNYEWDLGDGTIKSGMIVTHTYVESGIYTVTLTVKDAAGNSDSDSSIATVVESPSNGEVQDSPKDAFPWVNWVLSIVMGLTIALMLLGKGRKFRLRRRRKGKIGK